MSSNSSSRLEPLCNRPLHPQSWGAEGYHLWVLPFKAERGGLGQEQQGVTEEKQQQEEDEDEEGMGAEPQPSLQAGILQFHFIKSALTVNPCTVRTHAHTHAHILIFLLCYDCCRLI